MLVIGLTGGIGSGKSAAARFFSEFGVPVIDADHIARDVLDDTALAQQIISYLGPKVCDKNNQLNRHKLREVIFNDEAARIYLEGLLHPLIRERMQAAIAHSESPYLIAVIPLLIETQKEDYIDRILVIDVPEATQISRVTKRDGIDTDAAKAILATQTNSKTRLACAHDVIENTGSLDELKTKVRNLHGYYLEIAQQFKKDEEICL